MLLEKARVIILSLIETLKTDITHYCDLETVDGPFSLVAQDGSMVSVIRFNGTKTILSEAIFRDMVDALRMAWAPFFGLRGHQIQALFIRDTSALSQLEGIATLQHATARQLGLDVHDLIDENMWKYDQYVRYEECYFALWSRPALLDELESKAASDEKVRFRKENNYPATAKAQNLLRPISFLHDRHMTFANSLLDSLNGGSVGCSASLLDVDAALRAVRESVDRDRTATNWHPAIPYASTQGKVTHVPFRWKENGNGEDLSEMVYPPLPEQIMVSNAEIGSRGNAVLPDPTSVRVGNRVYSPVHFKVPPKEPVLFQTLFNTLNRSETLDSNGSRRPVPFALSIMIEGDGLSGKAFESALSQLLALTSEVNRNINLAKKALGEYKRDDGTVIKLRISAMTWADNNQAGIKELTLRKSKLIRALEAWGGPEIIDYSGNPLVTWQSNALALTARHIGEPCPAPIPEAIALLPLTRPTSPFAEGSIVFRSLDGKIMLYQRFSSEQTTWITLISGKPGSGKSVLLNNNNVEACWGPGISNLPYLCVVDIGISSSGAIDLIRDALPEDRKHLTLYKRLQNREEDCINPLDTPLGLRMPLPRTREFVVNFLTLLITPPEREGKAYEGTIGFIGRLVGAAYVKYSDLAEHSTPKKYTPGLSSGAEIDRGVEYLRYRATPATTYWDLVDAFFDAGMLHEAEAAQRFAMPTLNDLVEVASSPEIKSEYEDRVVGSGTSIIKSFVLGVREAVEAYPIFSGITRFDVGSARVMSLDLQDIAIQGGQKATQQTALAYMIAREAFMKKIAFSKEDVPTIPEKYRAYYEKLISVLTDSQKIMCMDEYHKTGNQPMLRQQLLTDGREARKWMLEIVLASQLPEDFGDDLTKIATAIFVLDSGTPKTRKYLRESIELSKVEETAMVQHVHGPSSRGTTFLARFETKQGAFTQLFTCCIGPMRLWALSTTAEDRRLRGLLYDAIPRPVARRMLADRFPGGSCKALVERMRNELMGDSAFTDDEERDRNIVEKMADDMINDYMSGKYGVEA